MVITVLEATVAPGRANDLRSAYRDPATRATLGGSAGPIESFLTQSQHNPRTWRIVTVWESQETLDRVRASGKTPRGVLVFRAAGAEPVLSVFTVAEHLKA